MPTGYGLGLCVNTDHGWLEINGHSLARSAFFAYDLWELEFGPDLKGNNSPKPNAPGVFPNRKRWAETAYDLPFLIAGEVDPDGDPYENDVVGFRRNVQWLRHYLKIDPDGTRTVPSIFHTADGQEAPGEVQVLKLIRGKMVQAADFLTGSQGMAMAGVLRVNYPGGGPIFPDVWP